MPRFDGFQQRDLDHDLLRGSVAQFPLTFSEHFHDAPRLLDREAVRLPGDDLQLGFRRFDLIGFAAGNEEQHQVAKVIQKIGDQPAEVFATRRQLVQFANRRGAVGRKDRSSQRQQLPLRSEAEHRKHIGLDDVVAAKADELVERGLGVAHAAVGTAGDRVQRGAVNRHAFLLRDLAEVRNNQRDRDAAQIEALAAGKDGGQHLLRVRGGEEKLYVGGRLFERLEQRIERRRREHVDFVDDVDLELRRGGRVLAGLAQLAHLFHAVVAGAVDLEHVERPAFRDLLAPGIVVGEVNARSGRGVQTLGEDAGEGGLARAARAGEQIGVGDAARLDRVGQRACDVVLTHDVLETLRAIFAG